jgi:hypothetical protein
MTGEVSTIYLLDVATNAAVEAQLVDGLDEKHIADWQTEWQPALTAVLRELRRRGVPPSKWPQSKLWNWRNKAEGIEGLLGYRGFAVTCEGMTQGLMTVNLLHPALVPAQRGKPLVYIEFLETAPWNRPDLGQRPTYRGVGFALVAATVALSQAEGFSGRVGLHSLPQSDKFYVEACGMTDLGVDPAYKNLRYFEFTPEQASAFLMEEE